MLFTNFARVDDIDTTKDHF